MHMINVLALTTCTLAMVSQWLVAHVKLKAVYVLGMVNGSLFVLLNTLLAVEATGQAAVALLVIPSAWMIFTSALGLHRLYRFEKSLQSQRARLETLADRVV